MQEKLADLLMRLKRFIENLPNEKVKHIFIDNMDEKINFWESEKDVDYGRMPTFKRGDIVHVCLGSNVGNEQGGNRYAIVIENSPRMSGTVIVIPVHGSDRILDKKSFRPQLDKFPLTGKDYHYLLTQQIRAVSKIRITKTFSKVNNDTLDLIDESLIDILNIKTLKKK